MSKGIFTTFTSHELKLRQHAVQMAQNIKEIWGQESVNELYYNTGSPSSVAAVLLPLMMTN